jgi:hypothetical protein
MKNLKRLGVSVTLMCVLAVAAFAGTVNSPPCAPEPGITNTPPCANASMTPNEPTASDETNSPPASNGVAEYSVSELGRNLIQHLLLLF